MPHNTRRRLCRSLAMLDKKALANPWKKHDNIPL
jgi:propionyl-CoA carboxylase beta chain